MSGSGGVPCSVHGEMRVSLGIHRLWLIFMRLSDKEINPHFVSPLEWKVYINITGKIEKKIRIQNRIREKTKPSVG